MFGKRQADDRKEIANENIVLLEELRKCMIKRFELVKINDIAEQFKTMSYNDLIRCLNFGFSEEIFFKETMQGKFNIKPFEISINELNIIRKNIKKFFK